MFVGRILTLVFGRCEPCTFHEVENGHRCIPELLTGGSSGFHVLALQFRTPGYLLLGVASHEGEVQRPPGHAQQGYPDQLLFEEKFQ